MTHFLVTGAAGFIGSHLVEHLTTHPQTHVTCVDNLITGNLKNLDLFADRITFIKGDITDMSFVRSVITDKDYVLHQAALPSVPRSIRDPLQTNLHNINGTLNLLIAARDTQVKRFIFASSSSVYGTDATLPKTEQTVTTPRSPYALTKLTGEHYCRIFYEVYGLETVSLRYFNVFGPRQNPFAQYAAVIPLFISQILEGKSPVIHGDGKQSRDFTFVSNVVQANIQACYASDIAGKAFNIGCGINTTINQVFKMIRSLLQSNVQPVYTKERSGDVRHSLADINAAGMQMDYKPAVSLEDGLRKTVSYYVDKFHEAK